MWLAFPLSSPEHVPSPPYNLASVRKEREDGFPLTGMLLGGEWRLERLLLVSICVAQVTAGVNDVADELFDGFCL